MENIPTLNAQVDEKGKKVSQYCLSLLTTVRKILEHLSNQDLINVSLVNKLWNFEARSMLRNRGTLRAKIWPVESVRSDDTAVTQAHLGDPCQRLVQFASDLENMNVVPFSGIRLYIYHNPCCQSFSNGSLNPAYKVILERLAWKHLLVRFPRGVEQCKDCPALVLVQKVFEDHGGELEELSVDSEATQLFEKSLQDRRLTCLKTLRVVTRYSSTDESLTDAFIKLLVSSAPNLEKIFFTEMNRDVYFEENFLEGSSAVLVPDFTFCPLCEQVCEGLVDSLRAEEIELYTHDEVVELGLLQRYVPMVLKASRTSLHTLQMDLLFAVPLMCYGVCLENITKLGIHMNNLEEDRIEPQVLALAKSLDFTRLFPKLDRVSIFDNSLLIPSSSDVFSAFVDQGNEALKNISPDRAINIRHLELNVFHSHLLDSAFPVLAQMFPHVQTLSAFSRRDHGLQTPFPFALLSEDFAGLKELNVDYVHEGSTVPVENFDSVFCGIFPEEAAELAERDEEFLRAVNIVPVRPSIRCMTDLRSFTFRLTVLASKKHPLILDHDPGFWFSKVSGLSGFARCPHLTVTFKAVSPHGEALGHMKPYVSSYAIVTS